MGRLRDTNAGQSKDRATRTFDRSASLFDRYMNVIIVARGAAALKAHNAG
jgi:hypothetical protein